MSSKRYLTFKLDNEIFALEVANVNGIDRMKDVTPVPRTSPTVAGVLNLRGKIVLAVNVRECFRLAKRENTKETCFIFAETTKGMVALIVDAVCEVLDLNSSQVEAPPSFGDAVIQKMITSLARYNDAVITIINPEELVLSLNHADQEAFNEAPIELEQNANNEANKRVA